MGLDNYWMFDLDDITGLEQGDEVEYDLPDGEGGTVTETYDVGEDAESVPTWVAAEAECPEVPDFDDNIELVGGLVSGNGPHSFRGKVYDGFVRDVAGQSLHVEKLNGDDLEVVAEALDELEWEKMDTSKRGVFHNGKDEFESFQRMFREMVDAGAWLTAWW